MRSPIGPHQRTGRWRRRGKVLVLAALAAVLALASSWMVWDPPPEREPPLSELAVARNYYALNGENGDSRGNLQKYPEFAPYIRGEVETVEECFAVG